MAGLGKPKTGGRQKGSVNKQTVAVQAAVKHVLEEIGTDAFEGDGSLSSRKFKIERE